MFDSIAERMKHRRQELGLSLQDVAESMEISKSTLQRYETGKIRNLPLHQLAPLAKALDTTPDWLLGWNSSHNQPSTLDYEFLSLMQSLGYEIKVYGQGKKFVLVKAHFDSCTITADEYHQLKTTIYSYMQYNADKLFNAALARERKRNQKDMEQLSSYLDSLSTNQDK